MKQKYTVIYTRRWSNGGHWNAQTKMKRVELEFDATRGGIDISAIADDVGTDDIQYIFPGWPPTCGRDGGGATVANLNHVERSETLWT